MPDLFVKEHFDRGTGGISKCVPEKRLASRHCESKGGL